MTTSEQARADAIADAETLRTLGLPYGPLAHDLSYAVCVPFDDRDEPEMVAYFGWSAARAAFRAVPGLR